MTVTVDIRQLIIMLLLVALIVLVIYLVVLTAKAIQTLKKTNQVLDDAKRISTVAAEKTEAMGAAADEAEDALKSIADAVRANSSLIDKASNIGMGISSLVDIFSSLRTDTEKEYAERARSRRNRKIIKKTGSK